MAVWIFTVDLSREHSKLFASIYYKKLQLDSHGEYMDCIHLNNIINIHPTTCFFIRDGGILWGRICLEGSGDRVEWGSSWSGRYFSGIREHLCRTFTGTMYDSLCWSCTRSVVKMCLKF